MLYNLLPYFSNQVTNLKSFSWFWTVIYDQLGLGVFWLIMCYVGQRFLVVHQEQEYLSDSSGMRGPDIFQFYLIPTNSGQQGFCDACV